MNKPHSELLGSETHHLVSVLRLKKTDKVELFDGKGTLAAAVVETANPRKVVLQVEQLQVIPGQSEPRIIIAPSIAKGERFDWLIGKCTELGVDRICPVLFERTVKQPKNPKTKQRWENLAVAAAKQCRRLHLPYIDNPMPLRQAIAVLQKDYPAARILLGSPSPQSSSLAGQPIGIADIVAFVGPEGGLTKDEGTFLQNNNTLPVRLADTVLRVETAAMAFAAILAAQRISQS